MSLDVAVSGNTTANSTSFDSLFQPIRIGSRTVRNRIVSLPHGQNSLSPKELATNFEDIAKHSAGMIILGGSSVELSSFRRTHFALFDRKFTRKFVPVAETVHRHNSVLISQLLHVGMQIQPSELFEAVWSASSMPADQFGAFPRAFDRPALKRLRASYRHAARNMASVDVDGFELHAAHVYLMNQFLSKKWNQRSDEYGGNLAGRSRIVIEILGILRTDHPDRIVGIRLPFNDAEPDGLAVDEALDLAEDLVSRKLIDYVTASVGARSNRYVRDESFPQGGMRAFSRLAKQRLGCAIVVSQRLGSPGLAADIIASGDADMVGLARPLLADPHWGKNYLIEIPRLFDLAYTV